MKTTVEQVSQWEQKIESLEKIIAGQAAKISEMEALIEFFKQHFKISQRKQFGSSSEVSPLQLRIENMFNEAEDQADSALPEPAYEEISYKRKKRTGKRADDLSGLPVERINYEKDESERICPECGDVMKDIGITLRDELEIIPARVIHKQHAVHAYGCESCGKNGGSKPIIKAEAPEPLIVGSLATPSAVAHIAIDKYVNGIPLYRIEKGFAYDGVVLSRQTMANWLIYCAQYYLITIYSLLISFLLKEDAIHADETIVQVLHEPDRKAQTNSYEWLYRTSGHSEHHIVIFDYKETRSQEHPQGFLKDFNGYVHADGYQGYHNLPASIIVVGCWSHCRRHWEKLYDTLKESERNGSNAERGLVYINLLFALEDEFRDLTPEERYKKRLEFSKPVSDDYFKWISSISALPKSLLGEAITYSLNQRKYLENVYLDGRLELSNNRAERSIKPFVQGRKQWLFSNTPNGAASSSIYYSIIETAKENNLNPFQYIKFLLENVPSAKSSDMESLLPWSGTLPDICRVPVKESNIKPENLNYFNKNKSLNNALFKLREKYKDTKVL